LGFGFRLGLAHLLGGGGTDGARGVRLLAHLARVRGRGSGRGRGRG